MVVWGRATPIQWLCVCVFASIFRLFDPIYIGLGCLYCHVHYTSPTHQTRDKQQSGCVAVGIRHRCHLFLLSRFLRRLCCVHCAKWQQKPHKSSSKKIVCRKKQDRKWNDKMNQRLTQNDAQRYFLVVSNSNARVSAIFGVCMAMLSIRLPSLQIAYNQCK